MLGNSCSVGEFNGGIVNHFRDSQVVVHFKEGGTSEEANEQLCQPICKTEALKFSRAKAAFDLSKTKTKKRKKNKATGAQNGKDNAKETKPLPKRRKPTQKRADEDL
jgi:hypothetical protein